MHPISIYSNFLGSEILSMEHWSFLLFCSREGSVMNCSLSSYPTATAQTELVDELKSWCVIVGLPKHECQVATFSGFKASPDGNQEIWLKGCIYSVSWETVISAERHQMPWVKLWSQWSFSQTPIDFSVVRISSHQHKQRTGEWSTRKFLLS